MLPSQCRRKKLPDKSAPIMETSLPRHHGAFNGLQSAARKRNAIAIFVSPLRNELPRGVARVREPEPENHIVESRLEKLEQRFAGHTAFAQGVLENPTELAFKQAILIAKFLFLTERDRVFGLFPPRTFRAVHS